MSTMNPFRGRPVTQLPFPNGGSFPYIVNPSTVPGGAAFSPENNVPPSVPQKRSHSRVDNNGDPSANTDRKRIALKAPDTQQTETIPIENTIEPGIDGHQTQRTENIPPAKADSPQTRDNEPKKRGRSDIERDSVHYDKEYRATKAGIRQKNKGATKRRQSGIESDHAEGPRKRRQSSVDSGHAGYESDRYIRAVKPGVGQAFPLREQSPWESYEDGYQFNVGGPATVTILKRSDSEETSTTKRRKVVVREILSSDRNAAFSMLCLIQGEHFVKSTEAYVFEKRLYVVSEHMPLALDQLIKVPIYPSEPLVALIVKQILAGIVFLESRGICHGSINCTSILANGRGQVKIGFQERCSAIDKRKPGYKDVKALGDVMSHLIKRPSTGIRSGENAYRYPWSDIAKDLILKTAFAPATDLTQHDFFKQICSRNELSLYVGLGKLAARRSYTVEWYPY